MRVPFFRPDCEAQTGSSHRAIHREAGQSEHPHQRSGLRTMGIPCPVCPGPRAVSCARFPGPEPYDDRYPAFPGKSLGEVLIEAFPRTHHRRRHGICNNAVRKLHRGSILSRARDAGRPFGIPGAIDNPDSGNHGNDTRTEDRARAAPGLRASRRANHGGQTLQFDFWLACLPWVY